MRVGARHDEVFASPPEAQHDAGPHADHIIAVFAKQEVVATQVGDDVVTVAAVDFVRLVAAVQPVIATVAPQGVDPQAANQGVAFFRSAEHDVFAAVVLQKVAVAIRVHVTANEQWLDQVKHRVAIGGVGTDLDCGHNFQNAVRCVEQVAGEVALPHLAQVGVAHHERGKGVRFQFVEQVHALGAAQVIEAVAILQVQHLRLKHEVEGGAQHAAKLLLLFCQAANPEINGIQSCLYARPSAGAVQVVDTVGRSSDTAGYQQHGGVAPRVIGGGRQNAGVGAIGSDEIDHRQGVFHVGREVGPAGVRRQA